MSKDEDLAMELAADFGAAVGRQFDKGGAKALISSSLSIVQVTASSLHPDCVTEFFARLLEAFAAGARDAGCEVDVVDGDNEPAQKAIH